MLFGSSVELFAYSGRPALVKPNDKINNSPTLCYMSIVRRERGLRIPVINRIYQIRRPGMIQKQTLSIPIFAANVANILEYKVKSPLFLGCCRCKIGAKNVENQY